MDELRFRALSGSNEEWQSRELGVRGFRSIGTWGLCQLHLTKNDSKWRTSKQNYNLRRVWGLSQWRNYRWWTVVHVGSSWCGLTWRPLIVPLSWQYGQSFNHPDACYPFSVNEQIGEVNCFRWGAYNSLGQSWPVLFFRLVRARLTWRQRSLRGRQNKLWYSYSLRPRRHNSHRSRCDIFLRYRRQKIVRMGKQSKWTAWHRAIGRYRYSYTGKTTATSRLHVLRWLSLCYLDIF